MRPLEITYSRQAERHFEAAGKWWRETRGASGLLSAEVVVDAIEKERRGGDTKR